jgi:hypothetical protein
MSYYIVSDPQNMYSMGGNCTNPPAIQDGNGYISDGSNYYYGNHIRPNDHLTPLSACGGPPRAIMGPIQTINPRQYNNDYQLYEGYQQQPYHQPYHHKTPNTYLVIITTLLFLLVILSFLNIFLKYKRVI